MKRFMIIVLAMLMVASSAFGATTFLTANNFAQSTLDGGINNSVTTINVQSGDGAEFPDSSVDYQIVVGDEDQGFEIMTVTARSTDAMTVTRAQEGTSGTAFVDATPVVLEITVRYFTDVYTAVSTLEAGQIDLVDLPDDNGSIGQVRYGTDDDIIVGYDEATDDRLEWHDGTNTLMSLADGGTTGNLIVSGATTSTGVLTASSTSTLAGTVAIGGGYGSTGLTLSDAGVVQMNGALTVDGTSTLTGAVGTDSDFTTTGGMVNIDGAAATNRDLNFRTGTSGRWSVRANATAEGGANAGTDLQILSRTDAGSFLATPVTITRSTSKVTLAADFRAVGNIELGTGAINDGRVSFGSDADVFIDNETADTELDVTATITRFSGDIIVTGNGLTFPTNANAEIAAQDGLTIEIDEAADGGTEAFVVSVNTTTMLTIDKNVVELGDSAGNQSTFAPDGFMTLEGTARVSRDVDFAISKLGPGPSNNPAEVVLDGFILVAAFDATSDEELFLAFEIPHDYDAGTDLQAHFHWAASNTGAGTVTWGIEWVARSPGEVLTTGEVTQIVTDDTITTADALQLTASIVMDGTTIVAEDVIYMRIFRDADASEGGADDDYASDANLTSFGVEHMVDRIGADEQF